MKQWVMIGKIADNHIRIFRISHTKLKSTTDPFEIELPIIDSDVSYQRVVSSFGYETETKILELIANDTITDYIELTN